MNTQTHKYKKLMYLGPTAQHKAHNQQTSITTTTWRNYLNIKNAVGAAPARAAIPDPTVKTRNGEENKTNVLAASPGNGNGVRTFARPGPENLNRMLLRRLPPAPQTGAQHKTPSSAQPKSPRTAVRNFASCNGLRLATAKATATRPRQT